MNCRKLCALRVLAISACIAANSVGTASAADTLLSQESGAESSAATPEIRLLPKLGGAIVKSKQSQQPVQRAATADADSQSFAPRAFRPVQAAAKLHPVTTPQATFAQPVAARQPLIAGQPSFVQTQDTPQNIAPNHQVVENPFVTPTTNGSIDRSADERTNRFMFTNSGRQPEGPQLEYHDLPQDMRNSLESKLRERHANNNAAPPAQTPQVQIKPLGRQRIAQLDDPFQDDPDQTAPPVRPRPRPVVPVDPVEPPDLAPGAAGEPVVEVVDSTRKLDVTVRRSKLIRTRFDIYRAAVVDTSVCDVVQFTPREVSIIGRGQGATHVTFWFEDGKHKPVTYLVRVVPDPEVQERREQQYTILEDVLAEMFPDSKVLLIPVADKLVVKGQAKGAAEAAQILAIIRGQTGIAARDGRGTGNTVIDGRASDPIVTEATERRLPVSDVINMLRVPGVQQVALRVKIAELNRTAARGFGVDLDAEFSVGGGTLALQSLLNFAAGGDTATSILGSFDNGDINFGIRYLQQKGILRILSEPTLVTMSGREANFIAGGEFAVPTTVGVGGASAVTTDFRAFGAIISFLPVVLDKDHIRLQVSPEFSKVNDDLTVDGTPGLDTRSVTTTVELREGQTLAIAGLLEDTMEGDITSDLPWIGKYLGRRDMKRSETELIIIVTPELVHPMDPEEVPPLPGFDVTEPTDREFYLQGRLEGRPTVEHRSTVWPSLRRRYQAGGDSMISGPFGHGQ